MLKSCPSSVALLGIIIMIACITACEDQKQPSPVQQVDLRKSESQVPDLASYVDLKASSPISVCTPCDNTEKRSIPSGIELFGSIGTNLLEFQYVDHEIRLIAYRQRTDSEFSIYYHKIDHMEPVKNKKPLLDAILAWTKSIRPKKKIDYDEDSFDDYFYEKNPPYVLIRTVSSEQPFTFVVGKKAKSGDYFINVFEGQAFLVDGSLFTLIARLSQTSPT